MWTRSRSAPHRRPTAVAAMPLPLPSGPRVPPARGGARPRWAAIGTGHEGGVSARQRRAEPVSSVAVREPAGGTRRAALPVRSDAASIQSSWNPLGSCDVAQMGLARRTPLN